MQTMGLCYMLFTRGGCRGYIYVNVCVQDMQIEREKAIYNISGGCTALVVVYLLGKLYVGNAGDSRWETHSHIRSMNEPRAKAHPQDKEASLLCRSPLGVLQASRSSLSKQFCFVCSSSSELSLSGPGKSSLCQQSSHRSQRDGDCSSW